MKLTEEKRKEIYECIESFETLNKSALLQIKYNKEQMEKLRALL